MRQLLMLALLLLAPSLTWGGNVPKSDVTVSSSATLVCGSNSARVYCNVTNNDAAINVRWGDSTVTATKGQQLKSGSSIEISGPSPVYMISESTDVTVSVTEEIK